MRRAVVFLGIVFTAVAGLVAARPGVAIASWVDDKCIVDHHVSDPISRNEAQAYAETGKYEGYEYAGGCWNDNDRDDTPGAPDSSGDGPDCSGFVFKTWELKNTLGLEGFRWWNRLHEVHGPYSSYAYHDPEAGWPFRTLTNKDRDNTIYMDAFAKGGHIGMLYTDVNPSDGTDYIIEALCDACGTNVFTETYRYDSRYVAVRRRDWGIDCPQCGGPPGTPLVSPIPVRSVVAG